MTHSTLSQYFKGVQFCLHFVIIFLELQNTLILFKILRLYYSFFLCQMIDKNIGFLRFDLTPIYKLILFFFNDCLDIAFHFLNPILKEMQLINQLWFLPIHLIDFCHQFCIFTANAIIIMSQLLDLTTHRLMLLN